jgi:hypothetical protein
VEGKSREKYRKKIKKLKEIHDVCLIVFTFHKNKNPPA